MDAFAQAGAFLIQPSYWLALLAGAFLSIVVGIVPGVGSLLVMALILPFLLFQIDDPAIALVMLASITGTSNTLDSMPAVLVGLPSSSTQVTFLEGHQIARRGEGAYALGAVYAVSAIGGIVGAVALAAVIPVIKPFVLKFSYGEIASMAMFGVAMVAVLSRGAMIKGMAAALFGVLIGTVGTDAFTGTARYTFGRVELWEGLPLVATILGIFAIPELIDLSMTRQSVAPEGARVSTREVFRGAREGLRRWKIAIRQSLYGVFLGAIPGVGSSVIDWLSYAFGIVLSKDRSQFGKGSLDGLLFTESAQNSKEGGQAIPTLTLGIPGGTGWIMILVAMMAFGITPGAGMLDRYAHITILIVLTLAIGNLVVTMFALFTTGYLARLTQVPYPIIGFAIIPMVFLSAFTDMLHWFAIPILLAFTMIGLAMKRFGWPRPPLVLGFILGPIIDQNLQTALNFYGAVGLLTRPIVIVLLVLLAGFTYWLLRAMQPSATPAVAVAGGPTGSAADASLPQEEPRGWKLRWRTEHLVPIAAIVGGVAFLVAALEYPDRAKALPASLSAAIVFLAALQLLQQALRRGERNNEIMDLGMRSSGTEGARTAAIMMAATLGGFLLGSMIIGLQYAAIALAFIGPVLFLKGRLRWVGAAITGAVVAVFAEVLMNRVMAVIWPQPAIWLWLTGGS